jgi:hypothetical protein
MDTYTITFKQAVINIMIQMGKSQVIINKLKRMSHADIEKHFWVQHHEFVRQWVSQNVKVG